MGSAIMIEPKETITIQSTTSIYNYNERDTYLSGLINNYSNVVAVILLDWSAYTSDQLLAYFPQGYYVADRKCAITAENSTTLRMRILSSSSSDATRFVADTVYGIIRK